jgi:hypothetical protein
MKKHACLWLAAVLLGSPYVVHPAHAKAPHHAAKAHVLLTPVEVAWQPAPLNTGLPATVQLAILSGDPFKPGPFALRLKFPDGALVPAHWHPMDEEVTVIAGTFAFGMGENFVEAALKLFPAGSYLLMPAQTSHFAKAQGETVVQINAQGPFVITYINPTDDPRPVSSSQ